MKSEGSPLIVFGTMLKHYRITAGLSPEQLGSRIYMSGSQIRKIEDGRRTPDRGVRGRLRGRP